MNKFGFQQKYHSQELRINVFIIFNLLTSDGEFFFPRHANFGRLKMHFYKSNPTTYYIELILFLIAKENLFNPCIPYSLKNPKGFVQCLRVVRLEYAN